MSGTSRVARRASEAALRALVLGGVVVVLAGCPSEPPRAPNIMRPLDEPHAVSIIASVFKEFNVDVERNRIIHVGDDPKELRLEVAAKGKTWGIAYLTSQEGDKLGATLPVRKDPDQLIIMDASGNGETGQRGILLYAGDYLSDDIYGDTHTATSIAAENKLALATRDVVRMVAHEGWR